MQYLKDRGFVHPHASEITPRSVYEGRRTLLRQMAAGAAGLALAGWAARDALALKPDYVLAHNNLGIILHGQDRCDEAEASYRRALALKPDYTDAHSNLLLFSMYADTIPPSASFAEHQRYGQHIAEKVAGAVRQHTPPTTPLNATI